MTENPSGTQHFHGTQVEFLVAAQGFFEVALGLGEGGRIENDGVVAAVRRRSTPLEDRRRWLRSTPVRGRSAVAFFSAISSAGRELSTPVTLEHFAAGCREEVQRESSLVAECVEGFAVRVLRRRRRSFRADRGTRRFSGLRGRRSGSGPRSFEFGRTLLSPKQSGRPRRQLLKFSNARLDALDDSRRLQFVT